MNLANKLVVLLLLFLSVSNCDKDTKTKVIHSNIATLEYKTPTQLGEGAIWNHRTQELYWVDIFGQRLHIYKPKTKINRSFPTPSKIGMVVPSKKMEAIIALEDGIYEINTQTGEIIPFLPLETELTQNRFNDGKCDPTGRLWVGSLNTKQDTGGGTLWKITAEGIPTKMLNNITISNGIAWTKDKKTMYYLDTPTNNIRAYDFDLNNGLISNERVALNIPISLGYPDGMTIDENDNLWICLWNGNAVAQYDPRSGKLLSKIKVPAHNVTACAFGGPDLDTLYITTASIDMTDREKEKYPNAGSVFKINPGVKGVKSTFFGQQGRVKHEKQWIQ